MAVGGHVVVARVDKALVSHANVEHGGAEDVASVVGLDLDLVVYLEALEGV